jgi:hypothetical protein
MNACITTSQFRFKQKSQEELGQRGDDPGAEGGVVSQTAGPRSREGPRRREGPRKAVTSTRPTGLAIGPEGELYISDDSHGRVWLFRPSHRGVSSDSSSRSARLGRFSRASEKHACGQG